MWGNLRYLRGLQVFAQKRGSETLGYFTPGLIMGEKHLTFRPRNCSYSNTDHVINMRCSSPWPL